MHKNLAKIKQSHPFQAVQVSPRVTKTSLTSIFGKMKAVIIEKSIASFSKFESKLNETPGVFVVPQQVRRVIDASLHKQEKKSSTNSTNKVQRQEKPRAGSHLNQNEALRLRQLLSKRQDLMDRLKKIDQSLQNHSPTPITFEGGQSGAIQDYGRFSRLKSIQSRINLKNSQTYNLVQHEKNVEMLSRLNMQKLRRQQKMVYDLKRKQQNEVKKLEEVQKNKSQLQLSRQLRPINGFKQAPKATFSEKLESIDPYEHLPVTNTGALQNEFDSLSQIPITKNDPSFHTEQVEAELSQNV